MLIVGVPGDGAFDHTVARALTFGVHHDILDLAAFYRHGRFHLERERLDEAIVEYGQHVICLGRYRSHYVRLIDTSANASTDDERQEINSKSGALAIFYGLLPGRIVNRPLAGASNASKPYQTDVLQALGLAVPASLSTNSPDDAQSFVARFGGRVIYKSNSSIRSIVKLVEEKDLARLHLVRRCPIFLQQYVEGPDVRVHVVGDAVFAEEIRSECVDYRYARQGENVFKAVTLPVHIAELCLSAARLCGLDFAGIDLKVSMRDGIYYALEVNPMPAYHSYDRRLDFRISDALLSLLSS